MEDNRQRKQNVIIALLIIILVWLGVLSWAIFNQDKNLDLHEFYLKQILQNF